MIVLCMSLMVAPFYGTLVAESNTHANTSQVTLKPYERIFKPSAEDRIIRIEFYHIVVGDGVEPTIPTISGYATNWVVVRSRIMHNLDHNPSVMVRNTIFVGLLNSGSNGLITIDSSPQVINYAEWKVYVEGETK